MIFEVLQQLLGEFIVDVQEENVSLYTGDLFEPSHFKLSDVFLKTSLINSLQLPFELSAGYIGNVKVEGLLGAVAGWPLEVRISDICLVLNPNKVPWENELLIRYAKELIVAICQSFGVPPETKKDKTSFTSPAKWISSRVQAAEMTVQLEHIHIRVESERSDNLVAYGLYIPLIRLASRDVEEQILYRRQQPGVTYPKAPETLMSKLLTIENVSFYTDLDAESYWTMPPNSETSSSRTEHPVASVLMSSPEADISLCQYTHEDALKRFKECALKPFARDKRRELVFIRVIWVKLDFLHGQQNENENGGLTKPVLAAVDVATEEIELNLDFDQIAMILEELEHVVDYFKRARMWQWRPSCIDREHHAPPSVKTSRNYLLPLPPFSEEDHASLIFSVDKQRKPKQWFRAMWRYAFCCIIDQQQRSRKETSRTDEAPNPTCWRQYNEFDDKDLHEIRRQRYMHLYARNLGPAAMEIALYGRKNVLLGFIPQVGSGSETMKDHSPSSSPRRRPLPEFDPLTQDELWELSDFVATMPLYEQRICRSLADRELRADFTAAPPSPTRRVSSPMEFSVVPTDSQFRHSRSHSVDSQPATPVANDYHLMRGSELTATPPSPARKGSSAMEFADALFRHSRSHSVDLNANERHLMRGSTIAFGAAELAVHHAISRPHSASTSDLPSPTKHENALDLEPLRAWIYKQRKLGLHTTSWFEKQFFPVSILDPAKVIPLLNWKIGLVKVRLSDGTSDNAQTTKRGIGIDVGIKSCSGAILLTRIPFLRILVEIRFGLFHVTLVRQPHLHSVKNDANSENVIAEYKWISSDYIHSPEDGFFYIGLKYSAQEVAKPTGTVQFAGNLEEELGVKGRMCIGPIKIDCNEAAMRMAMGQTVAEELRPSNMNVSTSTHFSVLQDAYHSFVGLVAHLPKRKGSRQGHVSSPRKIPSASSAAIQAMSMLADQQKRDKTAKRTRMLHALLLRSSTFEVEVGALELNLSAFTCHIEKALVAQGSKSIDASQLAETHEDVNVMLPTTTYRLQNRPAINECIMDVAGARIVYRSTKQGRAAVIRHLAQLFKL